MGMPPIPTARIVTLADITLSHCFEQLCTRSRTQKPHGTFYAVVSREIDEINVIMAGEVDCSTTGTRSGLRISYSLLTPVF